MDGIKTALTKHWKLGTLTFLVGFGLCGISIWQRQDRHNLVFTFSVRTISEGIQLPSLGAINPQNIAAMLHLLLEQHSLHASVTHHMGTFAVAIDSIPADSTHRAQRDLSTIYQQLIDRLSRDIDPTSLSVQLDLLDAQLALIAQTLHSTGLSAYERYALEHRALEIGGRRKEIRDQLDVVSTSIFDRPTSELYRAEQMGTDVLLLLSITLSAFTACAAMVLADSLSSNT